MTSRARVSLIAESLERRILLAADISFDVSSGLMTIDGTSQPDTVLVRREADQLVVSVQTGRRTIEQRTDANAVQKILFWGKNGNDIFTNDTSINSEAHGGPGRDRFLGGLGNDEFWGDDQRDYLDGRQGNDILTGGASSDFMRGGPGDDRILGESGNDRLEGGDGADFMRGGDGRDWMLGGDGNDRLRGGNSVDMLQGGSGNDILYGDAHADRVYGNAGNDLIRGGSANDELRGGSGNDRILAGDGHDIVTGDGGDDVIGGGNHRDVLIGGDGRDKLNGNNGEDLLVGSSTAYDDNRYQLNDILRIWQSNSPYEDRIAELQTPNSGVPLVLGQTIVDDAMQDRVRGNNGKDWYFLPGIWDQRSDLAKFLNSIDDIDGRTGGEQVLSSIAHADTGPMMIEHLAIHDLVNLQNVTHTAIATGDWSEPATWEGGILPSDDANVLVPSGISVTVDEVIAGRPKTVRVDGALEFDSTVDTELALDTLVVTPQGTFQMGTAEHPIGHDVSARLLIIKNGNIDREWDPFEFSRGAIIHGEATIYGAEKAPYATLARTAYRGERRLILNEAPLNWKQGDKLVLAGTDRNTRHDEELVVQRVVGKTVYISDRLDYTHAAASDRMSVHVANVSRNAIIESESLQVRGHLMFMHTRNVDVNYAGFYHLGRTNKIRRANDSEVNDQLELEENTGLNQRGRYAVHFHRNGVQNDGHTHGDHDHGGDAQGDPTHDEDFASAARVHGSVVTDSRGWGYVNHSSFVDFTSNVAYEVRGAAFVTEAGDEIGRFSKNLAIHSRGSRDGVGSRSDIQDFGHQGDGFWFQGAGVSVVDNVAVGQSGHGFIFFTRGLMQEGLGRTQFLTENLVNPSLARGNDYIDVGEVPLLEFHNNEAYGNATGVATRFHKLRDTHEDVSVLEGLRLWKNNRGLNIPYTNRAIIRDIEVIGTPNAPSGTGIGRNSVTRNITYENVVVEGFRYGIQLPERGENVIVSGRLNNVENVVITTAVTPGRSISILAAVVFETPTNTQNRKPLDIALNAELYPHGRGIQHVFYDDKIVWESRTAQVQLFFAEQAADFVPFPELDAYIPAKYVDKTNQELWDEFGVAVAGSVLPQDAYQVNRIRGFLLSI